MNNKHHNAKKPSKRKPARASWVYNLADRLVDQLTPAGKSERKPVSARTMGKS